MDVFTTYNGQGQIDTEMMDGDFDGKVDWVDHYQGGQRVSADVDVDYDGRVDIVYHYENGQMVKKDRYGETP